MTDRSNQDLVLTAMDSGVAVLTLNAPQRRNALSLAMRDALHDRLAELTLERSCRAIILTGAGGHFSAGADLAEMKVASIGAGRERVARNHRLVHLIRGAPQPMIAAVEGYAYGGGLSLAALCDYIICAADARFSASFTNVGLLPDLGLMSTLPARVGPGLAFRLLALATPVDGAEACRIGLADEVVPSGQAFAAAQQAAQALVARAPMAMALLKAALADRLGSLAPALAAEVDYQSVLFQTADHREAVAAFLAKRKPDFSGL